MSIEFINGDRGMYPLGYNGVEAAGGGRTDAALSGGTVSSASISGPAYVNNGLRSGSDSFPTYNARAVLNGSAADGGAQDKAVDGSELSQNDKQLVEDLRARDAEVRQHEADHVMASGGQTVGMPTYTYQVGPDGKRYAIGGSVNISMMTTGDEEEDARQARNAHRAATAAGDPSAMDMQTAMRAQAKEMDARMSMRDEAIGAYQAQAGYGPEEAAKSGLSLAF